MEAVIFYHSEQESTSGKFVGSKERVSIGLKSSHKSLNVFRTGHVTTFCGIKDECVKRVKRVRQRTVRQETTKFEAGTLPLNMYRSSPLDYPKEKFYLFPTNMSKKKRFQRKRFNGKEEEQEEADKEVSTNPQQEVEDEYDSTLTVKMNILWKKMMTMTPLQLLGQ